MKRLNKQKGMYALLIAVAAMIGITIYGSCSADEDYDGYSSKDELFTLADGEMSLRSEGVNGLYATITDTNKVFIFHPIVNPNDSSLFVYNTCDITITYCCDDSYQNVSIESVVCPIDDLSVIRQKISNYHMNPLNQSVSFKVSISFQRTINNTIYSSRFEDYKTIHKSDFHSN